MPPRTQPEPDRFLLALSGFVSDAVSGVKAFDLVADAAQQHLGCSYVGLALLGVRRAASGAEFRHRGASDATAERESLLLRSAGYWDEQRGAARWDHSTTALHWSAWPLWRQQKLIGVLAAQWPVSPKTTRLPGPLYHPFLKLGAALVERGLTLEDLHYSQAELLDENQYLKEEIRSRFRPENFVWVSGVMDELCQTALRVATSSATVLILGETGTGKEMFAHLIHQHSPRANGPFIRVNCGALPDALLESELFGHVRGAFTGATADRKGRFEAADGGTIFLDEIGDVSPQLQVRLLRVLQEREIERVGEQTPRRINVRVIAATHRDLEKELAAGRFREDLYYRLNVVYLHIPPLRQRREDILPLAEFFLDRYNRENLKHVQVGLPEVVAVLQAYAWPGNVRELQNCMEKAVVLSQTSEITLDLLPSAILSTANGGGVPGMAAAGALPAAGGVQELIRQALARVGDSGGRAYDEVIGQVEKALIAAALERTDGNKLAASRLLGINRNTLHIKMMQYGLRSLPAAGDGAHG